MVFYMDMPHILTLFWFSLHEIIWAKPWLFHLAFLWKKWGRLGTLSSWCHKLQKPVMGIGNFGHLSWFFAESSRVHSMHHNWGYNDQPWSICEKCNRGKGFQRFQNFRPMRLDVGLTVTKKKELSRKHERLPALPALALMLTIGYKLTNLGLGQGRCMFESVY